MLQRENNEIGFDRLNSIAGKGTRIAALITEYKFNSSIHFLASHLTSIVESLASILHGVVSYLYSK